MRRRREADYRRRRRAEKMNAEAADISLDEILKRDGINCYLCKKETSIDYRTLDHITPLIRGGSHTPSNVRIAHKGCNSKKGSKLLGEIDFSTW